MLFILTLWEKSSEKVTRFSLIFIPIRWMFLCLVSDSDQSPILDSSPTPLTRDFIGLCIGILSVVLVILIVAICKWSRCHCLKQSHAYDDQNDIFSSVLQQNASTPHGQPQRQPNDQRRPRPSHHRSSSCDQRPGSIYQPVGRARDDLISPVQAASNAYRLQEIKVPRVTITTLPVQPTQQLVPRLSISPQVSGSSIARSSYSLKQ